MLKLRDYQRECIKKMEWKYVNFHGNYLIHMAVGLGKTVTFSQFINKVDGRMLIISHRDELVRQPAKYFTCSFGIEMGIEKSSGEKVVSASIQTISKKKRSEGFKPSDFDVIIIDEAHHSAATSYKKVLDYFKPKCVFGFTATPERGDKVGLQDIFSEIIFSRDLRWGIENGYLSDITCKRVEIGYNISGIRKSKNDLNLIQLDEYVNIAECNAAIAETYNKYAKNQTLIFACSINHCNEIQKRIPSSRTIDHNTKKEDRKKILQDFKNKKFQCLINCMILTEGTDLPCVETVIMARPTTNESLYVQCVGRGTRLYPDKENLLLIDCVGVSDLSICSAPVLFGLKMDNVSDSDLNKIEGDLFDLESIITKLEDKPHSWVKNIKTVNIWAKTNKYKTHGVNYIKMPNGDFKFQIPNTKRFIEISKPNQWGNCIFVNGDFKVSMEIQKAFDFVFQTLSKKYKEYRQLWDTTAIKRWQVCPATQKQKDWIKKKLGDNLDFNLDDLNKFEAANILNRIFAS